MKRKSATRSALFMSVISMLLCVSMLVGTTFAWFTDEVQTGMNTIAAGNLDVELLADGQKVDSATKLFDTVEKWEPGVVVYENLQVANVGTLALKYQMTLNFGNENDLNGHKLSEVLQIAVIDKIEAGATRAQVLAAAKAATNVGTLANFYLTGELEAGVSSTEQAVVIFWAPNANEIDNLYNANNGKKTSDDKPLHIEFGVNLQATQKMSESDSFGPDYDGGAYLTTVHTEAELISALNNNQSVKLGNDIVLTGEWTPIGDKDAGVYYSGTLDGQGYTISGLSVTSGDYAALIGAAKDATIKNLTVEGAVSAENAAGVVARVEGATVVENVVSNVNVSGSSKAGGIACNVTNTNPASAMFINCVNNGAVNGAGTNGLGGIIGYVNNDATVEIISCINNGAVTGSNTATQYAGAVIGYAAGTSAGTISNFKNAGTITGKFNTDTRYLKDAAGTYLAGYCATPDNWKVLVADENGLVYMYSGEDKILYDVTAFAGSELIVPEGVTALRSGVFTYSGINTYSGIKSVTIPASVTDFGGTPNASGTGASGGAFKNSAVETVVLAEGMTEIPAAAFNQAKNLTSVNIPSSVTTIGINALAYIGMTELTVPETVTNIGYGAFRGMPDLTTVTIEGNVDIPVYAFRECAKLRTVILNGDNVTFGGGSSGMIFTNKQNGDGSAITVFVKNETVKDRLLTFDTAAKDYGGYKIVVDGVVTSADKLVEALENGKDVVLTEDVKIKPANMSNAYGTTGINVKNGQTIDGGGNTLDIKGAGGTWDSGISTTGGLIKNITVTGSFRGIFINHNSTHSEKVVLENVIIDGTTYTISCDQGTNQGLEAYNSTFNGWTSYAATLGPAKFVDCSFGEGNGYAYCRPYAPTEFVGCEFEAGYTVDPRAAVTFENCTIDGEALTAENVAELVTNTANVTVK